MSFELNDTLTARHSPEMNTQRKEEKNEKERLCMQHERSSKKILNFISRKQILWLKKEIFTTENKIFSVTRLSKPPGES